MTIPGGRFGPWLVAGFLVFGIAFYATVDARARDEHLALELLVALWLVAAGVLGKGLFGRWGTTVVRIDTERFTIAKRLWGLGWRRSGPTRGIKAVDIVDRNEGKKDPETGQEVGPEEAVQIRTKWRVFHLGLSLSAPERLWVHHELHALLWDIGCPVD